MIKPLAWAGMVGALLGGTTPARAWCNETFRMETILGLTADGSYYAVRRALSAGEPEEDEDRISLCLSDRVASPSWPSELTAPDPSADAACSDLCRVKAGKKDVPAGCAAKLRRWVQPWPAAATGPQGEKVTFARGKGDSKTETVTVWIERAGAKIAEGNDDELSCPDTLRIKTVHWTRRGAAVALVTDGRQQIAIAVRPGGAMHGVGREQNNLGMRRYKAKDWSGAMAHFRAALAADPRHVNAHYNLACAASLAHDVKAAVEQLEWLATSSDPAARTRLEKARTDPDLDYIAADPAVQKILGVRPTP